MTDEGRADHLRVYHVFPGPVPDAVVDPTGTFGIVPNIGLRHGVLNPLADPALKRFQDWRDEEKNFVRTAGSFVGLVQNLRTLLLSQEIDDRVYETLMGITAALEGSHPFIRLRLEEVREGTSFASVERAETFKRSIEMTNTIDIAISSGGIKEEAAVEAAKDQYDISRAEVFRRLARIRGARSQMVAWHYEDGGTLYLGDSTPRGFIVGEDGKLFPVNNESQPIETGETEIL